MNAIELLKKQHRALEELFDGFESSEGKGKVAIFEQIAANLVAHDSIERELFYPACERELGQDDDILGESLVEHGVVEFCLFRADQNRNGDELEKYVTVLREAVEHHVEEEEKELLPKVKRELDADQLATLGDQMEQLFDEVSKADFRKPLRQAIDRMTGGPTAMPKRANGKGPGHKNPREKGPPGKAVQARASKRRPRENQRSRERR